MQKRIGSDNYIGRPVQSFGYQHKKVSESIEKPNNSDHGVFASSWDIQDTMKRENKS